MQGGLKAQFSDVFCQSLFFLSSMSVTTDSTLCCYAAWFMFGAWLQDAKVDKEDEDTAADPDQSGASPKASRPIDLVQGSSLAK